MNYLSLQLHKSEEVQEKVGFFVRVMFLSFLLVLPRYFSQNADAFFFFFFFSVLSLKAWELLLPKCLPWWKPSTWWILTLLLNVSFIWAVCNSFWSFFFSFLVCSICWQYSPARTRSQTFRSVANRHRTGNKGNFISLTFITVNCWDAK